MKRSKDESLAQLAIDQAYLAAGAIPQDGPREVRHLDYTGDGEDCLRAAITRIIAAIRNGEA